MYLVELIFGLLLLIAGGSWLIQSTGRLAVALKIPTLVISLVLIAYGSSSPEIAVSISAAMKGANAIVIGNVVGSNIINIALVLALGALISPLRAHVSILKREAPLLLVVTGLMIVALLDGELSRLEGIFGIVAGFSYTGYLIYLAIRERRANYAHPEKVIGKPSDRGWRKQLLWSVISLAVMIYGAELFVRGAITLSESLGASPLVIGITVVAVGTSLPELVTTIIAARKGESDIAIGTVMGSNIFNILLVLGITATLRPVKLFDGAEALWFNLVVMALVTIAFVVMILTGKKRIGRVGASFLLATYVSYTVYLLW